MADQRPYVRGGALSTGNPLFDRQHADISRVFSDLVDAAGADAPLPQVLSDFDALLALLRDHFVAEEEALARDRSEHLETMLQEHHELLAFADEVRKLLEASRIPHFIKDMFVLEDRLFKHLSTLDLDALRVKGESG